MSISIKSGISNNIAGVSGSSLNALLTSLPTNLGESGYGTLIAEVDAGLSAGIRTLREVDMSYDHRLRVGIDKIIWQDTFNYNTFNFTKYQQNVNVQTVGFSDGFMVLNSSNSTNNGEYSYIQTWRNFSIFGSYPIYVDMKIKFSNTLVANSINEFGLGYASAASTPTDGAFFRSNGNGIICVVNSGGTEITGSTLFVPTANVVNHYLIVAGMNRVGFWVDDILIGVIELGIGFPSVSQSGSLPLLFRNKNSGIPSQAIQMQIGQIGVSMGDMSMTKNWESTMVGVGQSSIAIPNGELTGSSQTLTSGSTANIQNSTAPSIVIPDTNFSNTTAAYNTLGGNFAFSGTTSGETDYILFGYQNPPATATISGKNLFITGVAINTYVSGATVVSNPTLLQWSIGVGSTQLSLATTDSETAGDRAPRKITLGSQSFAVGKVHGGGPDRDVYIEFSTPLMVEPGTYCHIIFKIPAGVTVAGEYFRGICMINGYYE